MKAMARTKRYDSDTLADRALNIFWEHGYYATSMDDLVKFTGVNRHSIYKEYGGKRGMFIASFARYQETVVSPAFKQVERSGSDLSDVAGYFEQQISLAEAGGLPGSGCFVVNSLSEVAPHDEDVMALSLQHNNRLHTGFVQAINNSCTPSASLTTKEIQQLAETMVVFTSGLWTLSRSVNKASSLRSTADQFLSLIRSKLK